MNSVFLCIDLCFNALIRIKWLHRGGGILSLHSSSGFQGATRNILPPSFYWLSPLIYSPFTLPLFFYRLSANTLNSMSESYILFIGKHDEQVQSEASGGNSSRVLSCVLIIIRKSTVGWMLFNWFSLSLFVLPSLFSNSIEFILTYTL